MWFRHAKKTGGQDSCVRRCMNFNADGRESSGSPRSEQEVVRDNLNVNCLKSETARYSTVQPGNQLSGKQWLINAKMKMAIK